MERLSFCGTAAYFFGPELLPGNTLNPVLLRIGELGYHVQSSVLMIPDRLGFFSPYPPRLQVSDAETFASLIWCFGFNAFLCAICAVLDAFLDLGGGFVLNITKTVMTIYIIAVAITWLMQLFDSRRRPDYDWDRQADSEDEECGCWEQWQERREREAGLRLVTLYPLH
ncbi:hypothetical protein VTK56DRAFT_6530 [Thermocarpiscus australiensis]